MRSSNYEGMYVDLETMLEAIVDVSKDLDKSLSQREELGEIYENYSISLIAVVEEILKYMGDYSPNQYINIEEFLDRIGITFRSIHDKAEKDGLDIVTYDFVREHLVNALLEKIDFVLESHEETVGLKA